MSKCLYFVYKCVCVVNMQNTNGYSLVTMTQSYRLSLIAQTVSKVNEISSQREREREIRSNQLSAR